MFAVPEKGIAAFIQSAPFRHAVRKAMTPSSYIPLALETVSLIKTLNKRGHL